MSCAIAHTSQVTEWNMEKSDMDWINKIVKHLQKAPSFVLHYRILDIDSLTISTYADASFAGNKDLTLQLGMVVFLSARYRNCNLIHYGS